MKYRLGDIFKLQMGKTPDRSNSNYWKNGEEKWISISDLSNCNKYISDTKELISKNAILECGIKQIPKNTVVMSFKLSIGKVAITSSNMYSNEAIIAFLNNGNVKIEPRYLFYLLKQKKWNEGTNKAVMGITLNKATLLQVVIDIHDYKSQLKISDNLDQVLNIINLKEKQLNELDRIVKSRFVEMFGDPIINELKWKKEKLFEVAPIKQYKEPIPEPFWLLNLDMIEPNTGKIVKYIYSTFQEAGNSTYVFNEKNILYSKLRPYLNKVVIPDQAGMCTSELLPLYPSKCLERVFLAYLLRNDSFVKFIQEKVAGAKMPRVSMDSLKRFECIIPPLEIQYEFVAFVNQTDKLKSAVQKSLDETQLLFDSLMQEYFG